MNPNLSRTIQLYCLQNQSNINTALPVEVISYADNCVTCRVTIPIIDVHGVVTEYPVLEDVPIARYQGGGFIVTLPIKEGDEGIVLFMQRNKDSWYETGEVRPPLEIRMHDLSDGIFLPLLNSKPKNLQEYYNEGCSLQSNDGNVYIRIAKDKIILKGDIVIEGNINHKGDTQQDGDLQNNNVISQSITGIVDIKTAALQTGAITGGGGAGGTGSSFEMKDGNLIITNATIQGRLTVAGIDFKSHVHISGGSGTPTSGVIR